MTAAHWRTAAAEVVEDLSGIPASTVLEQADRIEALPYATPALIIEMIIDGRTPADAVLTLILEAMLVADGRLSPQAQQWTTSRMQTVLSGVAAAGQHRTVGTRRAPACHLG